MLTKKQKELYDFLDHYIKSNQISPSFEEMKKAVNLKSKSGIHRLITSLEQRGFIKRLKHKARAMEITKKLYQNNSNESSYEIPLLGAIAAGNPIEAIENPDEYISVPSNFMSPNNQYFGLKVKGLSMIDKGIFDGDVAVIKKTSSVLNGKIFIEFEDETIEINQGEMIVVPKGVKHKPYAKDEANIMLVEPSGVINTGDQLNDLTAPNDQWI